MTNNILCYFTLQMIFHPNKYDKFCTETTKNEKSLHHGGLFTMLKQDYSAVFSGADFLASAFLA